MWAWEMPAARARRAPGGTRRAAHAYTRQAACSRGRAVDGVPMAAAHPRCNAPGGWYTNAAAAVGDCAAPFDQPFHLLVRARAAARARGRFMPKTRRCAPWAHTLMGSHTCLGAPLTPALSLHAAAPVCLHSLPHSSTHSHMLTPGAALGRAARGLGSPLHAARAGESSHRRAAARRRARAQHALPADARDRLRPRVHVRPARMAGTPVQRSHGHVTLRALPASCAVPKVFHVAWLLVLHGICLCLGPEAEPASCCIQGALAGRTWCMQCQYVHM